MISAGYLKKILATLPDSAQLSAYEGEGIGLNVELPDNTYLWIDASPRPEEETQPDFPEIQP